MGKLKLQIDALRVESFDTSHARLARGTVGAHATFTCNHSICVGTCVDTCGNSLDYCTCNCTAGRCSETCTEAGPGCLDHSDEGSCPC